MRPLADIATDLDRLAAELRETAPIPPTAGTIVLGPTDSLQSALSTAPAGLTIELTAGAIYTGNFIIRKAVTIRTKGADFGERRIAQTDAPAMAQLVPGNNGTVLDILPGVADVTIAKLRIGPANSNDLVLIGHGDSSQTTKEQQPKRIVFDQVLIEGDDAAKRGIGLHGSDVTIKRCMVRNIKRVGQDSQAIGSWNGEGPYTISDCYLEAAGETVMFGGSDPSIPGIVPSDILIDNCLLTKNMAWKVGGWTVKNGLEFKAGRRVIVRDTIIENVWQAGQSGFAVQITPQSQGGTLAGVITEDITFERVTVRNAGSGFNILGTPQIGTGLQTNKIAIRNCWIVLDKNTYGGQGWPVFVSRGPKDVTIEQNTIETNGNQFIYQDGPPVEGFTFTGNLVPKTGAYGITGLVNGQNQHRALGIATYFPGGVITGNALGSFASVNNLPNNLHLSSAAITLSEGYGTGVVADYGRRR